MRNVIRRYEQAWGRRVDGRQAGRINRALVIMQQHGWPDVTFKFLRVYYKAARRTVEEQARQGWHLVGYTNDVTGAWTTLCLVKPTKGAES